ncbi:MAG: alpha-galactosidase [Propionibacteriales bacterium]|nr:alpha-galactosidase [Propionibacteriales bacterium]
MTATRIHLRAGGVSLLLEYDASWANGLPRVLHWGNDLGRLGSRQLADLAEAARPRRGNSAFSVPGIPSLVPVEAEGWLGRPGLIGSRHGAGYVTRLAVTGHEEIEQGVRFHAVDDAAQIALDLTVTLSPRGVARLGAELTNTGRTPYDLEHLGLSLPVPSHATEVLSLAGSQAHERVPQRVPLVVGAHVREDRKGRPGHDAPLVLAAGESGFGWESGEVWGVHLAWSGNQVHAAERPHHGEAVLAAGELLLPHEVTLAPGETYSAAEVWASHGHGLNELAGRLHEEIRARATHPRTPRKVLLNTWQAVYFKATPERLMPLVDAAAAVGVERFVVDDGWFRGRNNAQSALGDWEVDRTSWPDGLKPLVERVTAAGMEFGIWVEPEMINPDSDLARAHPDWILRPGPGQGPDSLGLPSRSQYVLDLANPAAYRYIAKALHRLLDEHPVGYLKWDHNRPVTEAGHGPTHTPGVRAHTLAVYRLIDELKARHRGLEIESCASGGGRIDLGILARTDRIWASDCIDALDRQEVQRWTQLLVPPELVGTHLGPETAHSTGRTQPLDFRATTALWGHFGIEWNLARLPAEDLPVIRRWVELHKSLRPLLHTGRVVVADHPDPSLWVHGVVAQDQQDAVFAMTSLGKPATSPRGRVRLPGLDPSTSYDVRLLGPEGAGEPPWTVPSWLQGKGIRLPGRVLGSAGVQVPAMKPQQTCLLRLTARQA